MFGAIKKYFHMSIFENSIDIATEKHLIIDEFSIGLHNLSKRTLHDRLGGFT